jgi:hypothetical protein
MKRQRLLFAAAAAGVVTAVVASMQITTSSPAYCAPKEKQPVEEELQGRRDADFRRPLRQLSPAGWRGV